MQVQANQKGFTLIELIVVVVILGILAATALPKFINVKDDAEAAAIKGVAGGVSSAFAVNYAGYMVAASKGIAVSASMGPAEITAILNGIMAGGLPSGYGISGVADCATGVAGDAHTVTVTNAAHTLAANETAAATLICTS